MMEVGKEKRYPDFLLQNHFASGCFVTTLNQFVKQHHQKSICLHSLLQSIELCNLWSICKTKLPRLGSL